MISPSRGSAGRAREARWIAFVIGVLTSACTARTGILEVTVPVETSGPESVQGLALQARVIDEGGEVRTTGPLESDAAREPVWRWSVEDRRTQAFTLEVCFCEAPIGGSCFDEAGACLGEGASRGGLLRASFDGAVYVGHRTRWSARRCGSCSGACAVPDLAGTTCDTDVPTCQIEGCCGGAGCEGVNRALAEPFCIDGAHFCACVDDAHLCATGAEGAPSSESEADGGGGGDR